MYQDALKWVSDYKDTEKCIKQATINSFTTYYVLENNDDSDTNKIASEIYNHLVKSENFKNLNNDTIREQFNPEVFMSYPSIKTTLAETGYNNYNVKTANKAGKATGTNVILMVQLGSGYYQNLGKRTSQRRTEYSKEYLVDRRGWLVFDIETREPVVVQPGIFDNNTIRESISNSQLIDLNRYVAGTGYSSNRLRSIRGLKFKKFPLTYSERSHRVRMRVKCKMTIYDVSRNKVLNVFNKTISTEDKSIWRIQKRGNREIFTDKLNVEYSKPPKTRQTLREECITKFEKKAVKWAAEKLSLYYP